MKDEKTKIKEEKIIELTTEFCNEKLNREYEELCVKLIEKMGRKHEIPFKRGKLEIWASAVIYAIGQINFLFDKTSEPYAKPDDICNYFNTKKSTVSNKARDIREMFNMGHFDKEFSLKSMLEIQPTFYIDEKSGMIIPEEFMINPMDSYFDEAYEHFAKGDIDNAIAMLDAIDKDNPEYERAMFYKSFILNASGIEDNSSEIFQEFISNFGENIDLNDILDDEVDLEDLAKTNGHFDENNPYDLCMRGELYFDEENYEKAIEYFDLSLKILPNQPNVLKYKSLALCELKKYKKAFKTIDKAIELTPHDDTLWATKGSIFISQKKYKKALKCLDKALEIDGDDIDYYIEKIHVYREMEDYENIKKVLDIIEKIDAENPEFLYEKGTYFLSEMEPEKAIIYYDKCLSIDDKHVEALLFKAMTCATLKREKEANDCIEKISEINPFLLMELNELFED